MTERCAETKFYPKCPLSEGTTDDTQTRPTDPPIPKFTLFDSSKSFESPQQVQASKASRIGEEEVKPTKLYLDEVKESSPKHKPTKSKPEWYTMAVGDSTDDDLVDVDRRVNNPSSSMNAPRPGKLPTSQQPKPRESSTAESSNAPPILPVQSNEPDCEPPTNDSIPVP